MFWRKHDSALNRYEYVAVLKLYQTGIDGVGKRIFKLKLADNSTQEHTFSAEELEKLESSFRRGGLTLNV